MLKKPLILAATALSTLALSYCSPAAKVTQEKNSKSAPAAHASKDYKLTLDTVAMKSRFESDTKSIWGGSLVKGDDGLYHLFYSQWDKDIGWEWVTESEIAHATSDSPFGPFTFSDVSLPARGAEYWDGLTTHNPIIQKYDGKYYLYHMGTTGDGALPSVPGKPKLNWTHRNNQRIGVAVADSPYGPWQRSDSPFIDVSEDSDAADALMTSNPSMTQRPDGGYLHIYKCVGKKFELPKGGPVLHCVATSETPDGPIVKHPDPIFKVEGVRFPAEDPYLWYQDGKYRAVVKRIEHVENKRVFSLRLFESIDGFDWHESKHKMVSDRTLTWEDGTSVQYDHLERPQIFIEDGKPIALLAAADIIDENNVRQSFNVQIPITFEPDK